MMVQDGMPLRDWRRQVLRKAVAEDVQGPFPASEALAPDSEAGEYLEQFVEGRIIKLWFWDQHPVAPEQLEMPAVVGGGRRTLAELVEAYGRGMRPRPRPEQAVEMIRASGHSMDDVLAEGARQLIDSRYGSRFIKRRETKEFGFGAELETAWSGEAQRIGEAVSGKMTEQAGPGLAYTVDAILDSDQRLWVLEVNSNPFIHPWLYPWMVRWVLRNTRIEAVAPAQQAVH